MTCYRHPSSCCLLSSVSLPEGWDLAAAEAVGLLDRSDPAVADGLASLIEKSIISRQPDTGRPRY